MTSFQRAVKYCALIFASLLAVGIISLCLGVVIKVAAGVAVIEGVSDSMNVETTSFTTEFDGTSIKKLNINNYEGKITIQTGDTFRVEAVNVPIDYVAEIRNQDTLYLGYQSNTHTFNFNFGILLKNNYPEVILTIPTGFRAESVLLDFGSGQSNVSGITAETINIVLGSGRSTLNHLTAGRLLVDSNSGSVELTDTSAVDTVFQSGSGHVGISGSSLGRFSLDSGSGSVSMAEVMVTDYLIDCSSGRVAFEDGSISGNISVNSGSGSVIIRVNGNLQNYSVSASVGSGGLWINGNKYSDNYRSNPQGAVCSMQIDGGSGRISIDLNE